jgi:site-specific DNA-methyltransferase (adenine-specific)
MGPTDTIGDDVRLWNADCLPILRAMPDASVDCVITDPPYSERTHKGHDSVTGRTAGDAGYDGADRSGLGYAAWSLDDVAAFVPEFCRVASGWVVVMTDHTLAPHICAALREAGRYVFAPLPYYAPGSRCRLSGDGPSSWTDWIIVSRTTKQLRWGTLPGGYLAAPGWNASKQHMGGKPIQLMRALVRDYSRKGDTVLDPFMGSGTTIQAAMRDGRKAWGIELDPDHYATALKRLRHATGGAPDQLFAGVV